MSNSNFIKFDKDFFKTLVDEGFSKSGVKVSLDVKTYLTKLLQFYIFSDHLFSEVNSSGKKQIKTLAEMYLKGCSAPAGRTNLLKKIGDTSLYVSGFFRESLKKKLVSLDYYIDMGKGAYQAAAEQGCEPDLFKEMSSRFKDLTFVLFYISRSSEPYTKSLLDRYLSGCEGSALELIKQGLNVPFKGPGSAH